jgi:hypothetical protein
MRRDDRAAEQGKRALIGLLVLIGGTLLVFPIVRDVEKCRSDSGEALRRLENYVTSAVDAKRVQSSASEICDSSTGVSFTVQLDKAVRLQDVVRSLQTAGCAPIAAPPGAFECITDGPRPISVIASRVDLSVRVRASVDL